MTELHRGISELTPQDIREFWEACGWKDLRQAHDWRERVSGICPYDAHRKVAPPVTDLDAVLRALEWFCNHTE